MGVTCSMPPERRKHRVEIYALLHVSCESERQIRRFLTQQAGIKGRAVRSGLHLTVYYSRRMLPNTFDANRGVEITANATETRFMVMAPGGENPRNELVPKRKSVGIRLTRRNIAIPEIQNLRRSLYERETTEIIGSRKPTTAWTNCFGARHFQPHITLMYPGSGVDDDLSKLGELFRKEIKLVRFDRFEIVIRNHRDQD